MDHRSDGPPSHHQNAAHDLSRLHADAHDSDPGRLLASVLIFYKDAMANQLSLTYLPVIFTEVQDHALESGSLVQRNIPLGDLGTLEVVSSKWARTLPDRDFRGPPTSPLVACVFFAIVNLQKSDVFTFKQSLEVQLTHNEHRE
jgi:hypothetical protein